MAGNLGWRPLGAEKGGADLRAVAVGDDEAVAVADEADDLARGAAGVGQLLGDGALFARANQGVAADGEEHGLHMTATVRGGEGAAGSITAWQTMSARFETADGS